MNKKLKKLLSILSIGIFILRGRLDHIRAAFQN